MLDKFKFNRWQIAYRIRGESAFRLIPNPPYGWCADPFLVEYQGKLYLFAEIFLCYSERNGVIGYCIYENGKFDAWKITMDRHWHLSYPNVFVYDDVLYMCPESYQRESVDVFRLVEFPDRWEKVHTFLENGKYVDTTFLEDEGDVYLFTFQPSFYQYGGTLLQCQINGGKMSEFHTITEDRSMARPGGNFIREDHRLIRVSQNSDHGYGYGLTFSEVTSLWPEYREHKIREIYPKDILTEESRVRYTGIHTYNKCHDLEVVDLKYACYSFREWKARKRVRKVFTNKYGE